MSSSERPPDRSGFPPPRRGNREEIRGHSEHHGHDLGFWLLALNVRYKANIGGLIRVASNFGASGVALVGLHRFRKAPGLALERSVPLKHFDNSRQAWQWIRAEGLYLVAAERTAHSTPIHQAQWPVSRLCFAVGSERDGLSSELLDQADLLVDVPMYGQSASMNLAVSAAVFSFEHCRRLGFPERPDLNVSGRVSGWAPRGAR